MAAITAPTWRNRYFSGLTWTGLAIVVIVAVLDATRGTIISVLSFPFAEWFFVDWSQTFLRSLMLALLVLVGVILAVNLYPRTGWKQYVAVALAVLLACSIGTVARIAWATQGTFSQPHPEGFDQVHFLGLFFPQLLRHMLLAGLLAGTYVFLRAEAESEATAHECDLEAAQLDEQAAQSYLQVLEAQIEPHFLFNALATVKRLFQTDPENGDRMLDSLMRYLAIALPQMRTGESTLGREAAQAEAYLQVQQIRMGRRLAYRFEIPESLRDARMPSLMLPTLVENAIKHGLGPLPEGGSIAIGARADGNRLHVDVSDTGRGFVQSSGAGTGLANIRARLATKYAPEGRLTLAPRQPHGVTVTITLPLVTAGDGR